MGVISRNFAYLLLSRAREGDIVLAVGDVISHNPQKWNAKRVPGYLLIVQCSDDKQEHNVADDDDTNKDGDEVAEEALVKCFEHIPSSDFLQGKGAQEAGMQQQRMESRNGTEFFVLWIPLSFMSNFKHLNIHHTDQDLGHAHVPVDTRHKKPDEWLGTVCVAVSSIERIQRQPDESGLCAVVLLCGSTTSYPIVFRSGGVTRFLEKMKEIVSMTQDTKALGDFIVHGGDAGSEHVSLTEGESGRLLPAPTRHSYSLLEGMQGVLYDSCGSETTAEGFRAMLATKVASAYSMVSLPQGTEPGALSAGIHFAGSLPWSPASGSQGNARLRSESDSVNSSSDDDFEILNELVPIEQQVPSISPSPSGRSMGSPLSAKQWGECFVGKEGRMDPRRYAAAKHIAFKGGLEKDIRLEVWCFLLGLYGDDQEVRTEKERQKCRDEYECIYKCLSLQWKSVFPEQERHFSLFREMRVAIDKDVVRTDRSHEAFAEDSSEKQCALRHVLMAHGMLNFDLGYCQGMSDVLSPIIILSKSEVEAFMCFRCLIRDRCINNFRGDVRVGMDAQLKALRVLVKHFIPRLFNHLVNQEADDMSFCFRWLLMLFKREFSLEDSMLLWDVIFSCPYTRQFELFVAAALLKAFTPRILEQFLTHDELLKFVNSTTGRLDVRDVILLAQDFYEEAARKVVHMDEKGTFGGVYHPTLDEMLEILGSHER
ncbi:Rab GTPase TBC domain [Trypanosoma vivax]|nr:Rab GTPase TBC domain [Trypanosoma vivax]